MRRWVWGVLSLAVAGNAAVAAGSPPSRDDAPRYALEGARLEPGTASSRYRVEARFSPIPDADERRAGGSFVLVGRITTNVGVCSADLPLFSNGFEELP